MKALIKILWGAIRVVTLGIIKQKVIEKIDELGEKENVKATTQERSSKRD